MPKPNQITACATASLQGIYVPEVRIYDTEVNKTYAQLFSTSYYFKGKTRDRAKALRTAREHIKAAKAHGDARAYLESVGRKARH